MFKKNISSVWLHASVHSFLLLSSVLCMDGPQFAYLLLSWRYLSGFLVLTIMNKVAINIFIQLFVRT